MFLRTVNNFIKKKKREVHPVQKLFPLLFIRILQDYFPIAVIENEILPFFLEYCSFCQIPKPCKRMIEQPECFRVEIGDVVMVKDKCSILFGLRCKVLSTSFFYYFRENKNLGRVLLQITENDLSTYTYITDRLTIGENVQIKSLCSYPLLDSCLITLVDKQPFALVKAPRSCRGKKVDQIKFIDLEYIPPNKRWM